MLTFATIAVAIAGYAITQKENDFLPPFNEGAVQLNAAQLAVCAPRHPLLQDADRDKDRDCGQLNGPQHRMDQVDGHDKERCPYDIEPWRE